MNLTMKFWFKIYVKIFTYMLKALRMMKPCEKYLFDLNGYIVVRNVFTPEEVI